MTIYSVAATILAVIGVITAIIGTGYFAIGTNYKQSIASLQEAAKIQKELSDALRLASENKDKVNGELSARNAAIAKELEGARTDYNKLVRININLQKEKIFYRQSTIRCHKDNNTGPIQEYIEEDIEDDTDYITSPILVPPTSVRKVPRE